MKEQFEQEGRLACMMIVGVSLGFAFMFTLAACSYTPARAYKLTSQEYHEAQHEFLSRKVEDLQEQVYGLRDRLDELSNNP